MAGVRRVAPSDPLRAYVLHYQLRDVLFEGGPVVCPVPARSEQILEFYLRDRYCVAEVGSTSAARVPPAVVVGPFTRRTKNLVLTGVFRNFTIHFQPTGFHRLFHVPMTDLTDRDVEASALAGAEIRRLHERLCQAADLPEMVRLGEDFLLTRLLGALPLHPVQHAAAAMLARAGRVSLERLADQSNLSLRQFERKFREQVGVAPKLYARIARFHFAVERKQQHPDRSWTEITYEAGYYDQAHLVKDFRALGGESPSRFLRAAEPNVLRVLPPEGE